MGESLAYGLDAVFTSTVGVIWFIVCVAMTRQEPATFEVPMTALWVFLLGMYVFGCIASLATRFVIKPLILRLERSWLERMGMTRAVAQLDRHEQDDRPKV